MKTKSIILALAASLACGLVGILEKNKPDAPAGTTSITASARKVQATCLYKKYAKNEF